MNQCDNNNNFQLFQSRWYSGYLLWAQAELLFLAMFVVDTESRASKEIKEISVIRA